MSRRWFVLGFGYMLWFAFFGGFALHDAVVRNADGALAAAGLCYAMFAAMAVAWVRAASEDWR